MCNSLAYSFEIETVTINCVFADLFAGVEVVKL